MKITIRRRKRGGKELGRLWPLDSTQVLRLKKLEFKAQKLKVRRRNHVSRILQFQSKLALAKNRQFIGSCK